MWQDRELDHEGLVACTQALHSKLRHYEGSTSEITSWKLCLSTWQQGKYLLKPIKQLHVSIDVATDLCRHGSF